MVIDMKVWTVELDAAGFIRCIKPGRNFELPFRREVQADRYVDAERAAASLGLKWASAVAPKPSELAGVRRRGRPPTKGLQEVLDKANNIALRDESNVVQLREPSPVLAFALEVKQQWIHQPNVGAFTRWLDQRIASLRRP